MAELQEAEGVADDFRDEVFRIPISKAGDKGAQAFIELSFKEIMNEFPGVSLKRILVDGLKVVLNSRMQKITGPKDDKSKADAMAKAEENLANLREGKVNAPTSKADAKVPQEVNVEATRLAKAAVKAKLKAEGKKVSLIAAKDITAAANKLLAHEKGKKLWETAKKNIEARHAEEARIEFDVSDLKEDATLKAKAEKANAEKKAASAAKKAGKAKPGVTAKAKPQAQHATAH